MFPPIIRFLPLCVTAALFWTACHDLDRVSMPCEQDNQCPTEAYCKLPEGRCQPGARTMDTGPTDGPAQDQGEPDTGTPDQGLTPDGPLPDTTRPADQAATPDSPAEGDGPAQPDQEVTPDQASTSDQAVTPDQAVPDQKSAPDQKVPLCPDGVKDPGEACDGKDLGGQTCKGLGFTGGDLACTAGCKLDTTPCYKVVDSNGVPVSTVTKDQLAPALAWDGTDFLVAWEDERGADADIYGRWISSAAKLKGSGPTIFCKWTDVQKNPVVVSDGVTSLVLWEEHRTVGYSFDVYGTIVAANRTIVSANGKPIYEGPKQQYEIGAAASGSEYLVVWTDLRNNNIPDIYGARVDATGKVLDSGGFAVTSTAAGVRWPRVAFAKADYLVAWSDLRAGGGVHDLYGSRVSQNGKDLDSKDIPLEVTTGEQWTPSVAFDGTGYLVAWADKSGSYYDIRGLRVDIYGKPQGTSFSICAATGDQKGPSLAYDGKNFLAVWLDERDSTDPNIYGARITSAGKVLQKDGFLISGSSGIQTRPEVAYGGGTFMVVWQDARNGNQDIYAARVQ